MRKSFTTKTPRHQELPSWCLGVLVVCSSSLANAAPVWKAPTTLPFGQLSVIELREDDPSAAPIPRPAVEDTLGPLKLRAVEPSADGHGWRFTVQPMQPGLSVIPPLDLGDGRRAPELRVTVQRTTDFGSPWVGFGGGRNDVIPEIPFPWVWASLLVLPLLLLVGLVFWRWRKRKGVRAFAQARKTFQSAWPPRSKSRTDLDLGHSAGRDLLSLVFGEASRGWGAPEFHKAHLDAWAQWVASLDAARFGRTEPPFPPITALLAPVDVEANTKKKRGRP